MEFSPARKEVSLCVFARAFADPPADEEREHDVHPKDGPVHGGHLLLPRGMCIGVATPPRQATPGRTQKQRTDQNMLDVM